MFWRLQALLNIWAFYYPNKHKYDGTNGKGASLAIINPFDFCFLFCIIYIYKGYKESLFLYQSEWQVKSIKSHCQSTQFSYMHVELGSSMKVILGIRRIRKNCHQRILSISWKEKVPDTEVLALASTFGEDPKTLIGYSLCKDARQATSQAPLLWWACSRKTWSYKG